MEGVISISMASTARVPALEMSGTLGQYKARGYGAQGPHAGRLRAEGTTGQPQVGGALGVVVGLDNGLGLVGQGEGPLTGNWGCANRPVAGTRRDKSRAHGVLSVSCHVEGSDKSLIYGEFGWEKIAVRRIRGTQPKPGSELAKVEAPLESRVAELESSEPLSSTGGAARGDSKDGPAGATTGSGRAGWHSGPEARVPDADRLATDSRLSAGLREVGLGSQQGACGREAGVESTSSAVDSGSGAARECERSGGDDGARELSCGLLYARHPVSRPQESIKLEEAEQQQQQQQQQGGVEGVEGEETGCEAVGSGNVEGKEAMAWLAYLQGKHWENSKAEGSGNGSGTQALEPVQERVVYLLNIGMDVAKAINSYPHMMSFPLAELEAKVAFLDKRGVRNEQMGKVLTACPQIFGKSIETELLPTARFIMEKVGVRKKDLGKLIFRYPRLLLCSVEQLEEQLQFLLSIGIPRIGKAVTNNPGLLAGSVEAKLLPKIEYFESLGIAHDDVILMFRRFPALFCYGLETNIRLKVQYLQQVMEKHVQEIVAYPQYFGCSFEHKIKPRYEYLCRQKHVKVSLLSMLAMADELFYERFSTARGSMGGALRKSKPLIRQKSIVGRKMHPV